MVSAEGARERDPLGPLWVVDQGIAVSLKLCDRFEEEEVGAMPGHERVVCVLARSLVAVVQLLEVGVAVDALGVLPGDLLKLPQACS